MSTRGGSRLFRRIFATLLGTWIAAVVFAVLLALALTRTRGPQWVAEAWERLTSASETIASNLHDREELRRLASQLEDSLDAPVAIHDAHGNLLAGNGPQRLPAQLRRRHARMQRGNPVVLRRGEAGGPSVHAGVFDAQSGEMVGFVAVTASPSSRLQSLAWAGGISMLLAIGVGALLITRSLISRLRELEAGVTQMSQGNLQYRVPTPSGAPRDELDRVAIAFNAMTQRLDRLVVGQRTLLANVSHELRTPVARMKVLLELMSDRVDRGAAATHDDQLRLRASLRDLAGDVEEMETLISDLLTSGRLSLTAKPTENALVRLDALVQRVAGRFHVAVADDIVSTSVRGDPLLLERLLSNLLGNALRVSSPTDIEIALRRRDDVVLVTIEDRGPGIPEEQREHVFEAFTRLDAARSRDRGGVGLGLFLARQIAQAHDGVLHAEGRSDGASGARLILQLPVARDPDQVG